MSRDEFLREFSGLPSGLSLRVEDLGEKIWIEPLSGARGEWTGWPPDEVRLTRRRESFTAEGAEGRGGKAGNGRKIPFYSSAYLRLLRGEY
jgi:hypothetical protein